MTPKCQLKTLKTVKDEKKVTNSFYECTRVPLLLLRFLGLLPLSNVRDQTGEKTGFSWRDLYTWLVFLPNLIIQIIFFFIQIYALFIFTNKRMSSFIFSLACLLETLLLLRFCQRWKMLLTEVENLEKTLPPVKQPQDCTTRIKCLAAFVISFAFAEHILLLAYAIDENYSCHDITDDIPTHLKANFMSSNSWYFELFPFSYTIAVLILFVLFQSSLRWHLLDVLIISMSIHLNNRFKSFNRLILPNDFAFIQVFRHRWSELQVYYTRICRLVEIVDDSINAIVFVSYIFNLYHICLLLYFFLNKITEPYIGGQNNCLDKPGQSWLGDLFKLFRIVSLVTRIGLVSHYASQLHITSRKPLLILHAIPTSAYNCDIQRLMNQVNHSKVGISGLGFFRITRTLMLSMLGKIMAYVLVLIQFDDDEIKYYE